MLQRLFLVLLFLMCHLSMPAQTDDEIVVDYDFLSSLALPVLDILPLMVRCLRVSLLQKMGGTESLLQIRRKCQGVL